MGITHPSAEGQERVVRMAYEKARLDPNLTAYAELHGTGTPVGDPIEVRAISKALNDTRSTAKPLLIGAVCIPIAMCSFLPLVRYRNLNSKTRSNPISDTPRLPVVSPPS
jgi:hypothetical protein